MRENVAVFVDAIYLYTFGSLAITGSKLPRVRVGVKSKVFYEKLEQIVEDVAPGKEILRVYWYDVSTSNRLHEEAQIDLCGSDRFKLRPVALHNHIVKTGIVSAIVKDMSDLAIHGGTSDCLVIARNDLLRPGIELCQSQGVRVHLLEVFKDNTARFSRLQTDVDTCRSWTRSELSQILYERELPKQDAQDAYYQGQDRAFESDGYEDQLNEEVSEQIADSLKAVVRRYVENLHPSQIEACERFWHSGRTGVPSDHDKGLLNECRTKIDRNLTNSERLIMRNMFRDTITNAEDEDVFPHDDEDDYEYDQLFDSEDDYDDDADDDKYDDDADEDDDSVEERPY